MKRFTSRKLLGAHVSTQGGLDKAPERGREIGADVIQVFTSNKLQWEGRRIGPEEAGAFREGLRRFGLRSAVTHANYLLNLASPEDALLRRSRAAFLTEMERCHVLGIRALVFHPGAHLGAGESQALRTVAESLDHVIAAGPEDVDPVVELTAGHGSAVGHRFEHVRAILDSVRRPERIGVCFDTCHVHAAGYDLVTAGGYAETMAGFERLVGFGRLRAVHLNDAKRSRGSGWDRHEAIGKGHLGAVAFQRLMRDPRFDGVPMVLETPSGMAGWKREIARLRRMERSGR
ncbi:MAG TPA: deoxyribonuclease IV [Vicinamibacteria bacterium]|nr:deoxyribonuclease IV [Vicinamibacteria bacterium]